MSINHAMWHTRIDALEGEIERDPGLPAARGKDSRHCRGVDVRLGTGT